MVNRFNGNLKQIRNLCLNYIHAPSLFNKLYTKIKNKKIALFSTIGAITALLGIGAWQALAANEGYTVRLSVPNRADTQTSIMPEPNGNTSDSSSLHVNTSINQPFGSGSASNQSGTNMSVSVNGQNIPVPENGSIHKVINQDNNKATVDISVDNHSSSDAARQTTHTYSNTNIKSNSNSSTIVQQNVQSSGDGMN